MGEQYNPSREEQDLFRQLRREIAAHTSEFAECVPWFETEYTVRAIRAREQKEHDRVAAEFGEKSVRARPPAVTSVAYVRLKAACDDLRKQGHDLSSIGRARRTQMIRRVLYVAWLQTDPDAHELGKPVFPWRRSYWRDPDLPADREFTRWWARQVGFDPDHDRERVWLKLVQQCLQLVRDERDDSSRSTQSRGASTLKQRETAGTANSDDAKAEVTHASDFLWLRVGSDLYEFTTTSQRQIIEALYGAWNAAGKRDGAGMTEAGIQEEVETRVSRVRMDRIFKGNRAFGSIVRRVRKATWALYLHEHPPSAESARRKRVTKKKPTSRPL